MFTDWLISFLTLVLTGVGLYLAHNYRRRAKIEVADERRVAYAELWALTQVAAPTLLDMNGPEHVFPEAKRRQLYEAMTDWYYRDGNGMLLEATTRRIYLKAKHNLICPEEKLDPKGLLADLPQEVADDDQRGCLSIRQLSLLRSQMKVDLAIFGLPWVGSLAKHERKFLTECGICLDPNLWTRLQARIGLKPGEALWSKVAQKEPRIETCHD